MRAILLCLALQLAAPIAAMQVHTFDSLALPAVTEVASASLGAIQDAPPNQPQSAPSGDSKPDVSIEVKDSGTATNSSVSPMWLAIGGIGLLLLIVLIVLAVRNNRGETTVVRQ